MKTAGRWSWKSKSAKECVTTHLPNQLAPKNGWRSSEPPKPGHQGRCDALMSRRTRRSQRRRGREPRFERPMVQILVLVANIQMKTLKTEVEKGFTRTSFGRE